MKPSTNLAFPEKAVVEHHGKHFRNAGSIGNKMPDVGHPYLHQPPIYDNADSAGRIVHINSSNNNDATCSVDNVEQATADENAFYVLVRLFNKEKRTRQSWFMSQRPSQEKALQLSSCLIPGLKLACFGFRERKSPDEITKKAIADRLRNA